MKKQLLIQLLLTLALYLGITFQTKAQSHGYESAVSISDAEAYKCANYFKRVHSTPAIPVSGGVITREALDNILKTTNCNAISFKFCQDSTGKIATPGTIFLVVSGANVTVDNQGKLTVTDINAPKYNSNDWCPPSCMKFKIKDPAGNDIIVE